jgi:hypothetical protein
VFFSDFVFNEKLFIRRFYSVCFLLGINTALVFLNSGMLVIVLLFPFVACGVGFQLFYLGFKVGNFGGFGLVLGLVTLLVWCKIEGKKLPKMSGKNIFRILYGIIAVLVLGIGMCMCMVWQNFIWGTIIGLIGIIMLISMIPMIKGLK